MQDVNHFLNDIDPYGPQDPPADDYYDIEEGYDMTTITESTAQRKHDFAPHAVGEHPWTEWVCTVCGIEVDAAGYARNGTRAIPQCPGPHLGVRLTAAANGHTMTDWRDSTDPYTGEPNGLGFVTWCTSCGSGGVWADKDSSDVGPALNTKCVLNESLVLPEGGWKSGHGTLPALKEVKP